MARSKPRSFETEVSPDESLCAAIVRTVASVSGASIDSLPPLFSSIDPDALEAIFSPSQSTSLLVFSYHSYEITVSADAPDPTTITVTLEEITTSTEEYRL